MSKFFENAAKNAAKSAKMVLSISRTKDVVGNSPGVLADIINGKREMYFPGSKNPLFFNCEDIHTVVLWTKNCENIVEHKGLKKALEFLRDNKVLVFLNQSVTGLGGTPIEIGIPNPVKIYENLQKIIDLGLIFPEAIKIRFDPFLLLKRLRDGKIFGNFDSNAEIFKSVISPFLDLKDNNDLKIRSVVVSKCDYTNYSYIEERIKKIGCELVSIRNSDIKNFLTNASNFCSKKNTKFGICCAPSYPDLYLKGLLEDDACIDGNLFNTIKKHRFLVTNNHLEATEILHNSIGKQRKTCRCTWSTDIGQFTNGIVSCFASRRGCIYCYAQQYISERFLDEYRYEIDNFKGFDFKWDYFNGCVSNDN